MEGHKLLQVLWIFKTSIRKSKWHMLILGFGLGKGNMLSSLRAIDEVYLWMVEFDLKLMEGPDEQGNKNMIQNKTQRIEAEGLKEYFQGPQMDSVSKSIVTVFTVRTIAETIDKQRNQIR